MSETVAASIDPAIRAAIDDLITRYAHRIDDDELELWPEFFTPDGTYQIISREGFEAGQPLGVMLCRGRGMMVDRIQAMRQANIFEPQRYTHILGPCEIVRENGDFRVRTNFHVVRTMEDGQSDTFATGRYWDLIVVGDAGVASFKERRVLLDSRRIDTLLVVPL